MLAKAPPQQRFPTGSLTSLAVLNHQPKTLSCLGAQVPHLVARWATEES